MVPGLGQAYCGRLISAPLFSGFAIFLVLSFLQAWSEWKRSALFLWVGLLVVGLFAANAAVSSVLARRSARQMERHAAIWRAVAGWWQSGSRWTAITELAFLFAFGAATIGVVLHWHFATSIAEMFRYWIIYTFIRLVLDALIRKVKEPEATAEK